MMDEEECSYCHEKKYLKCENHEPVVAINSKDSVLEVDNVEIRGTYETTNGIEPNWGWKPSYFKINYCPMCGRKLSD